LLVYKFAVKRNLIVAGPCVHKVRPIIKRGKRPEAEKKELRN
jgi:hypothetical protein